MELQSRETQLAKQMTADILASLKQSDNPMAILIENYIERQLRIHGAVIADEAFNSAITSSTLAQTYQEWEADRYGSDDYDVCVGC